MSDFLLEQVAVAYPHCASYALGPLDLIIRGGECLFISGPNGSGKTTLARALTGVMPLAQGKIWRSDGLMLDHWPAGTVAWLKQDPRQSTVGASVVEDIAWAPFWQKSSVAVVQGIVEKAVQQFSLQDLRLRAPHTLSGGEWQRAALAAVSAQQAELVILDEADAMLDSLGREHLKFFVDHLRTTGCAVLLISHHDVWESLADRTLYLQEGKRTTKPEPAAAGESLRRWQEFIVQWKRMDPDAAGAERIAGQDVEKWLERLTSHRFS
ncbi:MAG: ABC transporter ATP-binding protein [Firmicutes bacterium]|nr:ABC transporter ATP-binding protein [Bacillota bacterium]